MTENWSGLGTHNVYISSMHKEPLSRSPIKLQAPIPACPAWPASRHEEAIFFAHTNTCKVARVSVVDVCESQLKASIVAAHTRGSLERMLGPSPFLLQDCTIRPVRLKARASSMRTSTSFPWYSMGPSKNVSLFPLVLPMS